MSEETTEEKQEEKQEEQFINFDDFLKVELRVGQILSAEKLEKSEKLLKIQVSLGQELGERQVLAGIAKYYEAEELEGRKVSVVTNLAPRKMMGLMSEGMLLAASDDNGNLELVNPGNSVATGSRIS